MPETRILIFLFCLLMPVFCFQSAARAASVCANPAGTEGSLVYNSTYHVPQYCNDVNNWVAAGPSGAVSSGDITTNLVGWWKFDEASGNAMDSAGTADDGTITATATQSAAGGQVNGYIDLTGGYVTMANPATFDRTEWEAFTFAAWIKRDSHTGYDYLMSKGNSPGYYAHFETNDDRLYFDLKGGGSNANMRTVSTFTIGTWYHVALTKDGGCPGLYSGCGKIYVNGAAVSTTDNGNQANGTLVSASALKIGADSSNGNPFDGEIDDARWYDRSLSAADITALYNYAGGCANPTGDEGDLMYNYTSHVPQYCNGTAWIAMGAPGAGDVTSGLIHEWKFDEAPGSGTTADSAGSATGTLVANTTFVAGVMGNAISFDGTGDYVDVVNTGMVNMDANITITGWVNVNSSETDGVFFAQDHSTNLQNLRVGVGNACTSGSCFYEVEKYGGAAIMSYPTMDFDLPQNAWHHFAYTYDGTTNRFYYDGAVGPTTVTAHETGAPDRVRIGAHYYGTPAITEFWGKLDDLRIYNRALSAAEVLQVYQYTAGCLNPTGKEGDIMYNSSSHVMQFCNGAEWIKMGN